MTDELDKYNLDTKMLAEKLGYHLQYVRFLASTGALPAVKRGRAWRFNGDEVLKHLKKETNAKSGSGKGSSVLQ